MKVVHKKWMGKEIKAPVLSDNQKTAKLREKVVIHYLEFGLKSTLSAFDIGERTLFRWKKKYIESDCDYQGLVPGSRKRKTRNVRHIDFRIIKFIQRERMKQIVGKEKLYRMLKPTCKDWGIKNPSNSTIGRIIKGMKQNNQIPSYEKVTYYATTSKIIKKQKKNIQKQRRVGFTPSSPGELCQIDTVENRLHSVKRYTINIIDLYTRLSYSRSFTKLNSKNAQETIIRAQKYFKFNIQRVQTDNGLEFHKDFDNYLENEKIIHYWNYPKTPKMNAFIERFNKTIQEELLYRILPILKDDVEYVNEVLIPQYLNYYNKQRLHQGLDYMTPYDYYIQYRSKLPYVVN